jgi:hypothetical protein
MRRQLDLHGFVPWTLTIADAMELGLDWDKDSVIKTLRGAQKTIDELTIKLKEKNTWVGLTDEEKQDAYLKIDTWNNCVDWIEAKLKEKNSD